MAARGAQTIVLLGGTSDIGLAIVQQLLSPATRRVVLACRRPDAASGAAARLRRDGAEARLCRDDFVVEVVPFDAAKTAEHETFVAQLAERIGDLDVVVIAFGVLGGPDPLEQGPAEAANVVHVNFTGAVSSGLAVAQQLRRQGHGHLIVLSSVAAERVRRRYYVYGASKAGLDAFAHGLGGALAGTGVSVLVVRPGFVHSAMTAGRRPLPLATTPDAVARRVVRALRRGQPTVWAPAGLRYVFIVARHLPRALWGRLPQG